MAAAAVAGNIPAVADGGGLAVLAGRWQVDAASPLPAFDRTGAQAYAARDLAQPEQRLFALVCSTHLPVRSAAADMLKGRDITGLLPLLDYGPIDWPTLRDRRIAFVYAQPAGGPVVAATARRELHGSDVELAQQLLRPVVQALMALARLNIAHRAVRPDNLWFLAEDGGIPVLGDGVSAPAGYDQPSAYEPVERAMAQLVGRGEGTQSDDVFALGVTLLALAGRCEPGCGRSEAGLLAARLEKGSYYTLIEGVRLPLALAEPLRGMLADDPQARWSLRDVEAWLDGRRPALRSSRPRPIPQAPLVIGDDACTGARQLARALFRFPAAGIRAVRSGALELWVRNDLQDPALAKRIGEIKNAGHGALDSGRNSDEAVLARISLVLDPSGPVRYGGIAFAADGFGPVLAHEFATGGDLRALNQLLMLRLQRAADAPHAQETACAFAMYEAFLRTSQPGYGIERCLYEANPGLPCCSPLLLKRCVCDLADLLPALEDAAGAGSAAASPVDRHILAFIANRAGDQAADWLDRWGSASAAEQADAQVGMLAWIAGRYRCGPVPNLVAWIGRSLRPAVMRYHNRNTRLAVEREIRRAVSTGDLLRLCAAVCDRQRLQLDRRSFAIARNTFARLAAEIRAIDVSEPARRQAARLAGVHAAIVIACVAASASAGVSLLLFVR